MQQGSSVRRWPRRIAWSIGSLLLSSTLCAAVVAAWTMYSEHQIVPTASRVLLGLLLYVPVTMILSLPGYLLAVFPVVAFESIRGYRRWLLLLTGCVCGPASLLLFGLFEAWRSPGTGGWGTIARPAMIWSLAVSTLATLVYLGGAKWFGLYDGADQEVTRS